MKNTISSLISTIAKELGLLEKQVGAVIALLQEGNTIPFIARYRKEATNNLDEIQIRRIQERSTYLFELEERRQTILASIESQGKLTDLLRGQIASCTTKTALEDLYLPYKPKRRTRAAIAREKGLEPLALRILSQPLDGNPLAEAERFISEEKGILNADDALAGARDIAAETIAENAQVRSAIRNLFATEGVVISKAIEEKTTTPTKFEQYYDFQEKAATIPSHRYLAIRRGEKEGILSFYIHIDSDPAIQEIRLLVGLKKASSFADQLDLAIGDAFKRLIAPSIETDLRVELKLRSDREAVDVFAANLRNLLLASPLGTRAVIGIDPGIRTGCKCAAVNETGKFLESVTLYLSQGEKALQLAKIELKKLIGHCNPFAIGIGNGTAGRETEAFVRQFLKEENLTHIVVVAVSEAGASVYSASDVAREEFPDLDLTIRGAISIARRLQDPLAELVKVDPKSIGVGQYQHDVYQPLLLEKLKEVVESCVNHVGVELNTASASLLSYVAGIGPSLANKIVKHREQVGRFQSRQQLLSVSGLGPRAFEQAAGFLRVRGGNHPLDSSAVHPERYNLVESIAHDMQVPLHQLIQNQEMIQKINIKHYVNTSVGEHTLADIIAELSKPGRDPRAQFELPCFREDIQTIQDLKQGMRLEGIVTNVTAFGAFVDVGVHQDGLIHISEISDRFIKDPREVLQVGNKIQVEVLHVDVEQKRISLTAKKGRSTGGAEPSQPKKNIKEKTPVFKKSAFNHNPFANF